MNGYEAMKAALYCAAKLSPTEKIMLIALADHVNDSGQCWPSIPRLMKLTGLSRQGAVDVLGRLEANGLIRCARQRGKVTIYDLAGTFNQSSYLTGTTPDQSSSLTSTSQVALPVPVKLLDPNKPIEQKKEEEAAAAKKEDAEVGAVFTAFQENISQLTAHLSDVIGAAIDDYSPAWVLAAIKLAVERNKRSWKYIDGILKSWQAQGHMDHPQTQPAGNGSGDEAWQRVLQQIHGGTWTLSKSGPELDAVNRIGGWPRLRDSLDRDIPFIRQEFLREYGHGRH